MQDRVLGLQDHIGEQFTFLRNRFFVVKFLWRAKDPLIFVRRESVGVVAGHFCDDLFYLFPEICLLLL